MNQSSTIVNHAYSSRDYQKYLLDSETTIPREYQEMLLLNQPSSSHLRLPSIGKLESSLKLNESQMLGSTYDKRESTL